MNQTDPVCPCCGNRWDDRASALVGATFVTPLGAVPLSPVQVRLVSPLMIAPHTMEELCRLGLLVGERRFKTLLSRRDGVNEFFRQVRWRIEEKSPRGHINPTWELVVT